MFKVECLGCKAPYQVDERRVPATGLKMRCPKCGTSFKVDPPSADPRTTGPSPVFGAAPSAPAAPAAPAPVARPRAATMLGVAPGASKPPLPPRARAGTMVGVAPPRPGAAPAPPAPPLPAPPPPLDDLPVAAPDFDRSRAPTAPRVARPAAPQPFGDDLDLPAIPPAFDDLPAPAGGARDAGFGDLPAVAPAGKKPPLPQRKSVRPPAPSFGAEIDLPASGDEDLPAVAGLGETDLPSIGGGGPGGRMIDLPAVGGRDVDLPSLGGPLDLPSFGDDAGLPTIGGRGGASLPSPARDAGLPAPREAGLPVLGTGRSVGLPAPAAGLPVVGGPALPAVGNVGLPAAQRPVPADPFGDPFGGIPQRPPSSRPPGDPFGAAPSEPPDPFAAPGSFNAPPSPFSAPPAAPSPFSAPPVAPSPFSAPPAGPAAFAAPSEPPPAASPSASESLVRQAGGGTSFGEVNLGGGESGALEAGDEMEFGGIPQEPGAAPAGVAGAATAAGAGAAGAAGAAAPTNLAFEAPPPRRKVGRVVTAVAAVAVVGLASLALVPDVGAFGHVWIQDHLKANEYKQLARAAAEASRTLLAQDTYGSAKEALAKLESEQARSKRAKGLTAYAAFLAYLQEVRFGEDAAISARAKVALAELAQAKDVEYLDLARAAQSAAGGQLPRARADAIGLLQRDPRALDALVLRAEIELRARDPKASLEAWNQATEIEKSARTAFGKARAEFDAGDLKASEADAQATLTANAGHIGAKILLARIEWTSRSKESDARKLLDRVLADRATASPSELVKAHTLLGEIHLARSRITHAEASFAEALKIDSKAAAALVGLGDALYRSGRYSEALARFQAAVQADADDVLAQVGVAKTTIALERLNDAKTMLKTMREAHPKSMAVAYWDGRVQDALGNRAEAEAAYKAAIANGGSEPGVVDAYVALSLIQSQQGQTEEAKKTLTDAGEKLPPSPSVQRALGDVALQQGRHADALGLFQKALALDPDDVGTRFKLGVAQRRSRAFDDASRSFDEVAKVDADYPGLALERGLLFEASGRTDEALKAYESALAKAPNDPDLMLRVGCGQVSAGRQQAAEDLLRKVVTQRPMSAEANHCLGRALLLKGSNLAEALRSLERATEIDPYRAEYWLYVGWAATEGGRTAKAEESLKKALQLDQGLADAYWQRGVLRYRQGAVKDAVEDLKKALELRPSRFEAHAALADCYYDLGREADAMAEWQQAVGAQPDNATWHFRYGKLLAANHRGAEAVDNLKKAIELGTAGDAVPNWLWEAHQQVARALGANKDAIPHWEAFLRRGPRDSPYRGEAKKALAGLGKPWDGD